MPFKLSLFEPAVPGPRLRKVKAHAGRSASLDEADICRPPVAGGASARTVGGDVRVYLGGLVVLAASVTTGAGQEAGDPRSGLQLARAQCAACHAVERGNRHSIRPQAPAFTVIGTTAGMSGMALAAALQRSHRDMPDILLAPRERADVIAYILSLRGE